MIRIRTIPLAVITVATLFGGIAIAKSVGYYETTSSKEPAKFKTGDVAGLPNPADIRGSYTWNDIEKAFGVPAARSAAAFSVAGQALDPASRVSELETIYAGLLPAGLEIGTGAVRLFVALYTGLPFEAEAGSVLPEGALLLLASRPGMSEETLRKYVIPGAAPAAPTVPTAQTTAAPAVPADAAAKAPAVTAPAATPTTAPKSTATATTSAGTGGGTGTGATASSSGKSVVGKTTYGDLYDWGLTEAQVEAVTGFKPGARAQAVREAAEAAGIEFSAFKSALQGLVDEAAP